MAMFYVHAREFSLYLPCISARTRPHSATFVAEMTIGSEHFKDPNFKEAQSLRSSLHDSIHLTKRDHWDAVALQAGIYLQFEHLSTLEDTMGDRMEFRYAIFYCDQFQPIGIAYFQSVDFIDNGSDYRSDVGQFDKGIGTRLLSDMQVRCLVNGNVFHTGEYGFHFLGDIPLEKQIELVRRMLKRIQAGKSLDPKPSVAIFKEFYPKHFDATTLLEKKGYHKLRLDVNMIMKVRPNWTSLETYLTDLNTKSRTRFKNIVKKCSLVDVRPLTTSFVESNAQRMQALFDQVLEHSPYMFHGLDISVYGAWKTAHQDDFMLHGFFLDENLIGFNAGFVRGEVLDAHYVGVEYSMNKELLLYQRMLIDTLEFAIHRGLKHINFGRTAEQAKSTLGALPEDLLLYIKHRNSIANKIIGPFISSIQPSEYELREPFKKVKE